MSIFDSEVGATGSGALSGAGTGALIGSVVPGVGTAVGAGAGALLGGLTGWFSSHGTNKSADAQRAALDAAMKRLQAFSQQQYQNRMGDLDKTMAFYAPSQNYLQNIYTQGQGTQGHPVTTPGPAPSPISNPFDRMM